ncbi:MAG: efflux RND transporter periplasmic adaptor subunit [Lachnospiraceae bacterium]|nr:efflux RND transporter periplasmic adaptor subunit [Lachnospiraceae bacterium]
MQKKEKRGKVRGIVIALVVLVLLGAAAVRYDLPGLLSRNAASKDGGAVSYSETAAVTRGNLSVTAEGSGSVEAAGTKAVAMEYDGKLEEIFVETGDRVKNGDVLAVYDTDALDTVIEQKEAELKELNSSIKDVTKSGSTSITAPVAGRVKRIYAAVGDVVKSVTDVHGGIAEISADGKLKVEFDTPSVYLSEGDSVTVEFDSESVTGTVSAKEDGKTTVTIDDDTDYNVDTEVIVRGKSGEQIGTGKLESNHPYLVQASYGIVKSVSVSKTSKVGSGDTLFTIEDAEYTQEYLDLLSDREELIEEIRELKEYKKNPEVTSDCDGYIVTLDVLEGMPYEKDQQVCTIADEETLNLKVEIDELDIDGITEGQTAAVVFDAFEDETYTGTVKKISGVGNNTGGVTTYTVTIEMDGAAKIRNAMSATATMVTEEKTDVLLVPVDAVESVDGRRYVTTVAADGSTVRKEVTVGVTNTEYAEITEGLTEGETVALSAKNTADDFFSAMIETRNAQMANGTNGTN